MNKEVKFLSTYIEEQGRYKLQWLPLPRGTGHTLGYTIQTMLCEKECIKAETMIVQLDQIKINPTTDLSNDILTGWEDIVLNVQSLFFADEGEMILQADSPGKYYSKDVKLKDKSSCINLEDIFLFEKISDRPLRLELSCKTHSVTLMPKMNFQDGIFHLDVQPSPVFAVNYDVQASQLEDKYNYDLLIVHMEIKVHDLSVQDVLEDLVGSIQSTIGECACNMMIEEELIGEAVEPSVQEDADDVKVLKSSLSRLDISNRSRNALLKCNILTLENLLSLKESDLLNIPSFGSKCLEEVRSALLRLGLDIKV